MANTAALIETYRRAQQRIIEAILSSKSVAFNAGMLRTINAELARLQGRTVRWVESQIPEAYREGMRSVNKAYEKAYRAAGEVGPKNYPTEFSKINRRAIQLLVDNTKADFDNALGFVGRQIKDDLRQANLQAIADKLASGSTIDKTRKILAEKYASQGLAAIKYKRGGRDAFMSLDAYAGLVARSTTAEATNTACQKQVEEFGDDLVQMTTHANACPLCVSLEGRVYSISGKHPDYPALDLAYSDGYANIHPNCGHRLVPYIADLKTPEEIAEDKRISGRSFDIDKWSPAERAQAESNLKAYKLGQAKKRAIYTDRQQWERYKAELGPDNAPKSLSGFRSMKKADGDNWKELQSKYRASRVESRGAEARKRAEEEARKRAEADKIARRKAQIKAAAERRKAEALAKKMAEEAARKAAADAAKKLAEEAAKIARRKAQIKAAADRRKAEALAKKAAAKKVAAPLGNVDPLKSKLGVGHAQNIKKLLDGADNKDVVRVWDRYVKDIKFNDVNYVPEPGKATAFYSPRTKGICINIENISKDRTWFPPYETLFHEVGHLIDDIPNSSLWRSTKFKNGSLLNAAKDDFDKIMQRAKTELKGRFSNPTPNQLYIQIKSRFTTSNKKAVADISDMFSGLTGNNLSLGCGHSADYWRTTSMETEMFAEIFSASLSGPDSLAMIMREFPKAYEVFKDLISMLANP